MYLISSGEKRRRKKANSNDVYISHLSKRNSFRFDTDWRSIFLNCNSDYQLFFATGKSIRRIHSIHRNCIEDRIWAFSCESNSAAQVCSWTGFVNSHDDLLSFKCPNNGFISGIYSVHSNRHEDRRLFGFLWTMSFDNNLIFHWTCLTSLCDWPRKTRATFSTNQM